MTTQTPPAPPSERVQRLRSLPTIREQCYKAFDIVEQQGRGDYFDYHPENMDKVVEYCLKIIQRDYGTNYTSIPPHGRERHFEVNGVPRIPRLLQSWHSTGTCSSLEATRRLVDLYVVSVLLDAGAGSKWAYLESKTGQKVGRSEGLAVASLDMFQAGLFAVASQDGGSDETQEAGSGSGAHSVQAAGLQRLSPDSLAMAMQVHPDDNPMDGLEGRAALLTRLGAALEEDRYGYFSGPEGEKIDPKAKRPGFMLDYLLRHPATKPAEGGKTSVSLPALWEVVIQGLASIWPASRTSLDGVPLGDVWPCSLLSSSSSSSSAQSDPDLSPDISSLVPFHKLSQWLTYSLMEPMEKILGWTFLDAEHMTGLPEYRNGGLFVDLGLLVPRQSLLEASLSSISTTSGSTSGEKTPSGVEIPRLLPSHPAVVEWRALTVVLLDRTASAIRAKAGNLSEEDLGLKQVLESATWKGGREIAKELRGESGGGPPIAIESDGTVF